MRQSFEHMTQFSSINVFLIHDMLAYILYIFNLNVMNEYKESEWILDLMVYRYITSFDISLIFGQPVTKITWMESNNY